MSGALHVHLNVTNTGTRPGTDVVQLYVAAPDEAQEPPSQLKGFAKVSLQPGERKQIAVEIPYQSLAAWDDETHGLKLWPGRYLIKAAESSRDIRLESSVMLGGK